jgi:cytoskeletal protein RodZ
LERSYQPLLQLFYLGSFNLKNITVQIDGNLLASARQKAKLSVNDAASSCSLSSQQILSLETGSDAGFFNDQFKIICAKKYIKFLKLNSANVITVTNEESNIDRTSNTDEEEKIQQKPEHQFSFEKLNNTESFKVLVALIIIAIILFVFYYFSHHDVSEVTLDESTIEPEISIDLSTEDEENQVSLFEPIEDSSVESVMQEQDVRITDNSNIEQIDEISCNSIFQSTDIQNYRTPNVPDKPNNYVHIKSKQELPLCIQSNNGNIESFTVSENDPLTFKGQAPFTLYISNPEGVQVFFQGWQVWLNPNYQLIKLNSYEDPNLGGLE